MLSLRLGEQQLRSGNPNSTPNAYSLRLVSRNLFRALYRGELLTDLDEHGIVRMGHLALGLPRISDAQTQFDSLYAVVDPRYRFLDSMGFGTEFRTTWIQQKGDHEELLYGVRVLHNFTARYRRLGFPKQVSGPMLGYRRESRLKGFTIEPGTLLGASLTLNAVGAAEAVLDGEAAWTVAAGPLIETLHSDLRFVNAATWSLRAETSTHLPLMQGEESTALLLRLRGGLDHAAGRQWLGSAALLGLRIYSDGLLAEIGLQVTDSPPDLAKTRLAAAPELGGGL